VKLSRRPRCSKADGQPRYPECVGRPRQ
jgi:hypothetical protein